jgi:hypothetical protein
MIKWPNLTLLLVYHHRLILNYTHRHYRIRASKRGNVEQDGIAHRAILSSSKAEGAF